MTCTKSTKWPVKTCGEVKGEKKQMIEHRSESQHAKAKDMFCCKSPSSARSFISTAVSFLLHGCSLPLWLSPFIGKCKWTVMYFSAGRRKYMHTPSPINKVRADEIDIFQVFVAWCHGRFTRPGLSLLCPYRQVTSKINKGRLWSE